jgi:alpha-tubulin suppressor-like RCC1 family protein
MAWWLGARRYLAFALVLSYVFSARPEDSVTAVQAAASAVPQAQTGLCGATSGWTWGTNASGQAGEGTTRDRFTPVLLYDHCNFTAFSGGSDHSLGLKTDGSVWGWGANYAGQLGDGTVVERHSPTRARVLTGAVSIGAGNEHGVAATSSGAVFAWGDNGRGEAGPLTGEKCSSSPTSDCVKTPV